MWSCPAREEDGENAERGERGFPLRRQVMRASDKVDVFMDN